MGKSGSEATTQKERRGALGVSEEQWGGQCGWNGVGGDGE